MSNKESFEQRKPLNIRTNIHNVNNITQQSNNNIGNQLPIYIYKNEEMKCYLYTTYYS